MVVAVIVWNFSIGFFAYLIMIGYRYGICKGAGGINFAGADRIGRSGVGHPGADASQGWAARLVRPGAQGSAARRKVGNGLAGGADVIAVARVGGGGQLEQGL